MRFTVVWLPGAEDALAELWTPQPMRRAIAHAAGTIDALLRENPHLRSTALDCYFFLRVDPLVVLFEVSESDRIVRVIEVHQVGPDN
jgi:hypothetical protein